MLSYKASCILIPVGAKFLAISRKFDNTKWGFPGGKADIIDGVVEDFLTCAKRELFEETGIEVEKEDLLLVYSGMCEDFEVETYLCLKHVDLDTLNLEEGVESKLMYAEELIDKQNSPFFDYNKRVFNNLDL